MNQKRIQTHHALIIARARLKHTCVVLVGTVGMFLGSTGLLHSVEPSSVTVTVERIRAQRNSEKQGLERYRMNRQLIRLNVSGVEVDLMESLQNDPDALVRLGAAQKLGNYTQNSRVVKALSDRLNVEVEPAVRYACVQSLSLASTFRAMSTLEKFSEDPDPVMRRVVAFYLKKRNEPRAKLILKKMRRDGDASVRLAAREEKP